MVVVLLLWSYIFILSTIMGFFALKQIYKFVGAQRDVNLAPAFIAGTLIFTVYAQFFSLLYKVGAVAHIIMIALCAICLVVIRKDYKNLISNSIKKMISLEGLVYFVLLLVCAFFTSRGSFHADTLLYHAQSIRWIEEFGVVKGLGHIMPNYAYNSSWLCYTALFSMKWLTGTSFHVANGLMMAVMLILAVSGLIDFKNHKNHYADAIRISTLVYIVNVCVVAMSPSTDQPSMFLGLYIVLRWLENMEEDNNKDSVHTNALLCVAGVYTMTLKLSAGLIVLLVISPLITLIKTKNIKSIIFYLALGIITILPYFARNYYLSGWLIYPFASIDLFNVEWKIPIDDVINESNVIKAYARKVYEPDLANMPIIQWFVYWWKESEHYDRQILLANVVGVILFVIGFIKDIIRKRKLNWNLILLNVSLIICVAFWFVEAPFIRFALGYLIAFPVLSVLEIVEEKRISLYKIIATCGALAVVSLFSLFWYHYCMDTLMFIKQNYSAKYYVVPKDYDATDYQTMEKFDNVFYFSTAGQLSYYSFPGIREYEDFIMMGDEIKDGFKQSED